MKLITEILINKTIELCVFLVVSELIGIICMVFLWITFGFRDGVTLNFYWFIITSFKMGVYINLAFIVLRFTFSKGNN